MGYYSTIEGGITFEVDAYIEDNDINPTDLKTQADDIKNAIGVPVNTRENSRENILKNLAKIAQDNNAHYSPDENNYGHGYIDFTDPDESKHYNIDKNIINVVDALGDSIIDIDIVYHGEDWEDRQKYVYQDGKLKRGTAKFKVVYEYEVM